MRHGVESFFKGNLQKREAAAEWSVASGLM